MINMAHCWAIVKILFVTKVSRHRTAEHLAAAALAGFEPAGIRYSAEPVAAAAAAVAAVLAVLAGRLAAVVEAECH